MVSLLVLVSFFILYLMNAEIGFINAFNNLDYNLEISYQLITLLLAISFIFIARLLGGKGVFEYLNLNEYVNAMLLHHYNQQST